MTKDQKHRNFKRIATQRTNEILEKIISMENFTNKSFYDFDWKDIEKIYTSILTQLTSTTMVLKGTKPKGFKL